MNNISGIPTSPKPITAASTQSLNRINIFKIFISIILLLILINLAYLDFMYFKNMTTSKKENVQSQNQTLQTCPNACISEIYKVTSASKLATPSAETTQTPTKTPSSASKPISQTKEFFIPFGTGSSSAGDWEDVAGLKAYIDSTQYSSIKSVVFEASVRIPTGNQVAYVRLFNETDKHPVWFSEVSMEGGTSQLLVSQPITLSEGNKLYKVQMKTQLKFQANLDQARVHIITE